MAQALLAVGAGVNAVGTVIGGKSEAKQLKSEARQLERNAGLERATSQRQSIDERRQAELASSRALALGNDVDHRRIIGTPARRRRKGQGAR